MAGASVTTIQRRQNDPRNLRLLAAARQRYADRKRAHRRRSAGTVALALASPVVLVAAPDAGPILGALAGVWLFFACTVLAFLERRSLDDARRIQDSFDRAVFDLPADPALGRGPVDENVTAAADRWRDPAALADWYPADGLGSSPRDVLISQRSSVAWGQRLHYEYAWLLGDSRHSSSSPVWSSPQCWAAACQRIW